MMRKPRVLVLAEECNPEFVSVPLVGWSHYLALSEIADVHLVTQIRNRPALLRFGLTEGRDVTFIDSEAVARPAYLLRPYLGAGGGKGWTIITALLSLTYPYFEHLLWNQFGPRITAGQFDIVHRIVPLSPTTPSLIAAHCKRAGVPFILGPLNGGLPWPRAFTRERRREREWLSYFRGLYKCLPDYHATWRNASAVLIGSRNTWSQVPRQYRHKCFYMPENAIDPSRFTAKRTRRAQRPIRVTFVGRLVPYKGPDMLLEAAADLIRSGDLTVEIIGDGPLLPELKSLVSREKLSRGVTFTGWLDHHQIPARLADSDLLGFPSIREFGGGVVLEAMAVGTPPLVVDYGGPAELVTDQTGFLIPLGSRSQIIASVRQQLDQIVADPSLIESRSAPAMRRAREQFTWQAKALQTLSLYHYILGQTDSPPDFPMPLPDLSEPHNYAMAPLLQTQPYETQNPRIAIRGFKTA
jgi:glycosyltransferase involved in cell wall biosynthesis